MSLPLRCVILTSIAIAGASAPLGAQRQTLESVKALHRWVDAVNAHTPGQPDDSAGFVAGLTYSARVELNTSYSGFIRVLDGDTVTTRSALDTNVVTLAREVLQNPGAAVFLERAAILHADALIFARKFPRIVDDAPPPQPRAREPGATPRGEPSPPLLYNHVLTMSRDGEVIGDAKADWNLPFARSLLEVLLRLPKASAGSPSAFVSQWYHALAAFLFAHGKYADAQTHLEAGVRVLPNDPQVFFDRGIQAETFGLPIYQVVLDDPAYRWGGGGIPAEGKTNQEAERSYRRAVALDPSFVEARVRLARLLERRGQVDEAAAEIASALAANPTGVPGYYARIVAGRIASTRGRYDEALRHYRAALQLFAQAESALLGVSHAALMLADVPEALKPLAGMDKREDVLTSDPWWDYELGAGRDSEALLAALWARAIKP